MCAVDHGSRKAILRILCSADEGFVTADGIEHILTGWDHLAFVIGLLFLVGFNRRLLLTITAFTAAHSLTLQAARWAS